MKKFVFFRTAVVAAILLSLSLVACSTGPKLQNLEEPEVLWQQDIEFNSILALDNRSAVVVNARAFKMDEMTARIMDVRTGEVTADLNTDEIAIMYQEAAGGGTGVQSGPAQRIYTFPEDSITVLMPIQRGGLFRNNCKEPIDDIVVTDSVSGRELQRITRKGVVFDLTVVDGALLLFYYNHIDSVPGTSVLVKHSLETGTEEFATELGMKLKFGLHGKNYSGILVSDGIVYLSSEGISAVDFSTGRELWSAENSTVTGVVANMVGFSFVGSVDPTPVFLNDSVVFRNIDGVFRSVNPRTGAENWTADLGWSDGFVVDRNSDRMFVSLGLAGVKPATDKRPEKPTFKGDPGLAAYDTTDGTELWTIKFSDSIVGTVNNGDSILVFSGNGVYSIAPESGEMTRIVDMKKDWGISTAPLTIDYSMFGGELLLFFSDRLVWVNSATAEKIDEIDLGMSIVSGNVSGVLLNRVNNSLLFEAQTSGMIYLYVIDEPSRRLRYYQSIASGYGMASYLRYDSEGLYLLGHSSRGVAGSSSSVSLTAYRIP